MEPEPEPESEPEPAPASQPESEPDCLEYPQTPPRFLLLWERDYAKGLKKPVAISLEFGHSCYRGLTTATPVAQLARKWMVATGTKPSIIAQKPNDDTIRMSCTLSRTFAF